MDNKTEWIMPHEPELLYLRERVARLEAELTYYKKVVMTLMAKHLIKCRKDIYRDCCLNGIHCLQEGKII